MYLMGTPVENSSTRTDRGSGISGPLLVLAAAMLWGTTGTSQALAPTGATPAAVGALRLAVGGAALLAVCLIRGELRANQSWSRIPTACAAFFIAAYQLSFFAAVSRTGVAVGTMIGIGSSPVIAGILALLLGKQVPGKRWCIATALAVTGCILLTGGAGGIRVNLAGVVLALCAGASYAAYTMAIKELLPGRSPDAVIAVVFTLGALLLSPLLFTSSLSWMLNPRGIAVFLHLGLIATALSYSLFSRGLATVPVASAVTLSLAEPMTAALLGVTLLGERLTKQGFCGMAFLFAGLALLTIQRRK